MAETNTVYVVTGSNRGIGLCLVQLLLARPRTVVVGTVRSDEAKAQLLSGTANVAPGPGSKLISVLVDYSTGLEATDIAEAFGPALAEEDVKHVDALIANAGHTMKLESVLATTPAQMRELYEINTIGPMVTFQGLWELMTTGREKQGRSGKARYVLISSSLASIGMMEPMPGGAYGPSKAAANWIAKAVHSQYGGGGVEGNGKGIVGVAVHPGWVKTRMGDMAAGDLPDGVGPNLTAEESAKSVLELVDRAEELGGKYVMEGGRELLW